MNYKYGARIYPLKLKVIVIKQTIKKPESGYVIDRLEDGRHREKHVRWDDSEGIADAVRRALRGELQAE
ncbi:hypothetical protein ES703_46477 [subsurface metagenome]